jgi:hypothetical protein
MIGFCLNGQNEITYAKLNIVYIYNFTRYITWPKIDKLKEFRIAILGNEQDEIFKELRKLGKSKTIDNLPIRAICFRDVSEITECEILYVDIAKTQISLNKILDAIKGNQTLLITENNRSIDKSMISFVSINGKQAFAANELKILEAGLKSNPQLYVYGKILSTNSKIY